MIEAMRRPRRKRGVQLLVAGMAAALLVAALGASSATAKPPVPSGCVGTVSATQYPNCTYPSPHAMGMFDRMASAGFQFNPADQDINKTYFGMPQRHVIWDLLMTNDQGKYYLVSPSVLNNAGTLTALTWTGGGLQESPSGGLVPDPRHALWGGPATFSLAGGKITYSTTSNGANGGPETITYDQNSWKYDAPNSDIHLTGVQSGGGTSWNLPWREPSGATNDFFYNIHGYKIQGTYHGEHVTGHAVLENMWATTPYFTSWWVRNRIGHWSFFNIDYKNG